MSTPSQNTALLFRLLNTPSLSVLLVRNEVIGEIQIEAVGPGAMDRVLVTIRSGVTADLLQYAELDWWRNAPTLTFSVSQGWLSVPADQVEAEPGPEPIPPVVNEITDAEHGSRSGGSLHSLATTGTAGFLSAADKVRLDAAVTGPVSSVDNSLPRFNGTTGLIIQGSGVVIDDSNNMFVPGNLTVQGTLVYVDSEALLLRSNHLYLNADYVTPAPQTGGLVVNYLPTATTTTVAGAYVAGVAATSNPTVTTTGSGTFALADLVQVSGSPNNDGLFEVLSHVGTLLTIRGIGLTATVESFTQNQFTAGASDGATITKVTLSVLRSGTDGLWEVGAGAVTPLSFADLGSGTLSGAGVNNQIAVWSGASSLDGGTTFTWDSATQAFSVDGSAVFNESGGDFDFRVEGDTRANLLLVDAGTDRVGINRAAGTHGATLDVDNLAVAESIFIARDAGTAVFTIADAGDIVHAPATRVGGSPTLYTLTAPAHLTLAMAEATDINWNLTRPVEFAGPGVLAVQRAVQIQAPTYGFAALGTITDAATFAIGGAPVAGPFATLTNSYALWVQSGTTALSNGAGAVDILRIFDNTTAVWKFLDGGNLEMQGDLDLVPLTTGQGEVGTAAKSWLSVVANGLTANGVGGLSVGSTSPSKYAATSPAQITANQNDYAIGTGTFFRLDTDASRDITGITGGADGREIIICNVGGFDVVLTDQDANSTAANRIITGTGVSVTLSPDDSATLIYDSTTARWRVIAVRQ